MVLIQYLRDQRKPKGVVVAIIDSETNQINLGWSKCSKKDRFKKDFGKMIAINRANHGHLNNNIPSDITPILTKLQEKAQHLLNTLNY